MITNQLPPKHSNKVRITHYGIPDLWNILKDSSSSSLISAWVLGQTICWSACLGQLKTGKGNIWLNRQTSILNLPSPVSIIEHHEPATFYVWLVYAHGLWYYANSSLHYFPVAIYPMFSSVFPTAVSAKHTTFCPAFHNDSLTSARPGWQFSTVCNIS